MKTGTVPLQIALLRKYETEEMIMRLSEIAKLFGLTYSSVSRRVGIVRKQLREDKRVKAKLDRGNALIEM